MLNIDFIVRLGKALQKYLEADAELHALLQELGTIEPKEDDTRHPDEFDTNTDPSWYLYSRREGNDMPRTTGEPRWGTFNYYFGECAEGASWGERTGSPRWGL